MAVVYISEAEAIRDFASVLAQVRAGTEVIIEDQDSTIALVKPAALEAEEPEPGHDEWFRAEVERTLQNDPANRISEEDAEIIMAERRRAVLLKLQALPVPTENSVKGSEPGYDDWFGAQIDEALADPRPSIESEVVEAYFAKRRSASALKIAGLAG